MAGADQPLPARYRDRALAGADASDTERRVGALFRAVDAPEPLSAAELGQVRRRLARRAAPRFWSFKLRELALTGLFVLAGAGVASAGLGLAHWVRELSAPAVPSEDVAAKRDATGETARRRRAASRPAPAASDEPAAPAPAATDPGAPSEGERHDGDARRGAERPFIGPSGSAAPSELGLESAALGRALVQLRRERNASAALALLDAYEAEFPHGALLLEARVARVDALLALGRKAEALGLLTALPLARAGRGTELLLLRAELLAERDCARALGDFDALLRMPSAAGVAERAIHGRAVCRLRAGDTTGAVSDLRAYLARYPDGRFADEVRATLSRLRAAGD